MSNAKNIVKELLSDPNKLLQKKPFYRGLSEGTCNSTDLLLTNVELNETIRVSLPNIKKNIIPQSEFLKELDPNSHKVLFDQNIPTITMKIANGGWVNLEYKRMAVSYQRNIKDKQVLHLCNNPMQFTLLDTDPTDQQQSDFVTFKQYWKKRNQDGMKNKMVDTQKSVGDAGLLYYFDMKGRIKSRILSYADGYVLCPHDDDNGDRVLESVYYKKDDVEYIDSYDDTYMYRYINDGLSEDTNTWRAAQPIKHGFSEIPLITKRGDVAWNNVQSEIEVYEVIYNIFLVIQKRHGWGILYIKGRFDDANGKKIAGSVILNDKSMDTTGDAKFLTPPSPQGTIETLEFMEETIQKGSGTTFILPKDIKTSGDISAVAIMLTQSLDIETAAQGVIEWQNVADKMARLFKEGLAKELVNRGIQKTAITDFENLDILAEFKVWRPHSDTDFAQMLVTLKGSGLLSEETGIELNPVAAPDEKARRKKEVEEQERKQLEKEKKENT